MERQKDICTRLGERVRRLRERRGWGQEDLAAESGIGRPFISNIETGKREPCLYSLEAIANSFDMTVSQLMRGI